MSIKEQLKAEIERLKNENNDRTEMSSGARFVLNDLLSFLDTLKEQPVELDIRKELASIEFMGVNDARDTETIARHFYELGCKRTAVMYDDIEYEKQRRQEQPVCWGLEEEVKRYYSDNFAYLSSDQPTLSILTNVARHFAQWQKEQMMDEWLKDRDGCFWDGVNEGKKAMREQMLNEAVEGKVCGIYGNWVESEFQKTPIGEEGDKVKLIIIKED